jgi:hypothetical protein
MAYNPKTWSLTDPITDTDLNHIETGIADVVADVAALPIKCGTHTFTGTVNTGYTTAITFSTPFGSTPVVTATPQNEVDPQFSSVCVSAVSTTGFNLRFYRTDATRSTTVGWIATTLVG